MAKKTILLVDDNIDILEAIRYLLEDAGHVVISSENGDYLEHLDQKNFPDLILLDMLLSGGKGGEEIAQLLKQGDKTRQIPIIMMSAHPSAREAAKRAGADDFVAKPFDIEELLSVVNKHLL